MRRAGLASTAICGQLLDRSLAGSCSCLPSRLLPTLLLFFNRRFNLSRSSHHPCCLQLCSHLLPHPYPPQPNVQAMKAAYEVIDDPSKVEQYRDSPELYAFLQVVLGRRS